MQNGGDRSRAGGQIVMNRKRRNTVSKVGLAAQGNAASPAAKQTNAGRALEKLKSSDRAARHESMALPQPWRR